MVNTELVHLLTLLHALDELIHPKTVFACSGCCASHR